jgi:MFS family permease
MSRAWAIVGATVATQATQAGLLIYGFSTLALPLEQAFGTSRAEVMITATCLSLASSALAPLAGRAIDRGSVRRLMLLAAAMLGGGFVALSQAPTLWAVWAIYALLLAPANVLLGQLSSAALVTRWFDAQRGRAMGLSTLGTSLGGFVFPVLLATLIEASGWRTAVLVAGVTSALLAAVIVALTVEDRPKVALDIRATGNDRGMATAAILARPAFWIITFGVGIKIATYFGLINNLAAYGRDLGVDAVRAAALVSLLSVTSMAGKLGFGFVAERLSLKWLFVGALALTVVSFAVLLAASDFPTLVVAALMLGLATGGMLPLWGLIVAEQFGPGSFGRALGLTNLMMVPLTAAASPVAGWTFDRTGSYDGVILGSIALLALAAGLVALLPKAPEAPEAAG